VSPVINLAYINGEVLRWARQRLNLSVAEVERKLDDTDVGNWESGTAYPPFGKAEALADTLRIPFGYLFLSHPPADSVPLPDFRTLRGPASKPSADLLDVVNDVLRKQEWYRDHLEDIRAARLKFVGSFSLKSGPERVADDIRHHLGITPRARTDAHSWVGFMRFLVVQAESLGILVLRSGIVASNQNRPLSVKEFRGFAISDSLAPLVFINARDSKAAQIFTLIHELVHIWLGQSGISNPDPTDRRQPRRDEESFCNRVTAEVLMPTASFLAEWKDRGDMEEVVSATAAHFRVSTAAVLWRARELNKLSDSEYRKLVRGEKSKQQPILRSGGSQYRNLVTRNSEKLVSAVVADVRRGRVLYRDAARLLNTSLPMVVNLVQRNAKEMSGS
jgi:Zn-dependent peptidase ImmA (M78 family)/transcriptional regulator with XRE-family HTH domain